MQRGKVTGSWRQLLHKPEHVDPPFWTFTRCLWSCVMVILARQPGIPWPSGLRLFLPISMKATTAICTHSCHGGRICPGFSILRATYGTSNAKCFNCINVWILEGLVHGFWKILGTWCECLEISCSQYFHMRSWEPTLKPLLLCHHFTKQTPGDRTVRSFARLPLLRTGSTFSMDKAALCNYELFCWSSWKKVISLMEEKF